MSLPGPLELVIIFLVVLLIFGAKRIPEIAQGVGKGIREFKNATRDIQREIQLDDSQNRIQQPRAPQQTPTPRGSYQQTENTGQGS
ncbi:MAG: twin-arginine translocase TatA/TatE family subunit [Bacteroidota bacterium]